VGTINGVTGPFELGTNVTPQAVARDRRPSWRTEAQLSLQDRCGPSPAKKSSGTVVTLLPRKMLEYPFKVSPSCLRKPTQGGKGAPMSFTIVPILAENPSHGFSQLAVEVGIIGEESAQHVDVALICSDPTHQGKGEIEGKKVTIRGRSFSFQSDENGPLSGRRWYYLPQDAVDDVKAVFDVVSVDRIHVQVFVDGQMEVIDGKTMSAFVDKL